MSVASAKGPRRLAFAGRSLTDGTSGGSTDGIEEGRRVVGWIDMTLAFIYTERTLVIRHIRLSGKTSLLAAFSTAVKVLLILNVHIWGWYLTGRHLPGSTSYIVYNTGGFIQWFLFGVIVHSIRPSKASFDKNLNIKWIHVTIAHIISESMMVIIGTLVVLGFYTVFSFPYLGVTLGQTNIPLLILVSVITGVLGIGCGLIMSSAEIRWPIARVVWECAKWLIFITSGLYTAYTGMPWYIAQYAWYSPLMVLLEYSRKGLDTAYPCADLSIPYAASVAFAILFIGLGFRRWVLRSIT